MKRAAFAAVFLVIVFFCCGICLFAARSGIKAVHESINEAYYALQSENDIPDAIFRIEEEWQARHPLFRFVFGSDSCFLFESTLGRAKARSMTKEKSPELFSELSSLDNCLKQIWQTQQLNPENLF